MPNKTKSNSLTDKIMQRVETENMKSKWYFWSKEGLILGVGALALLSGGIVTIAVNTQTTGTSTDTTASSQTEAKGKHKRGEMNSAAKIAIDNGDYTGWAAAVKETPRGDELLAKINENNFSRYIEMLKAERDGDTAISDAIRAELGFPTKAEMEAQRTVVDTALVNADYEAWKTAIASMPRGDIWLAKIDTQAKFDLLTEMHKNQSRSEAIRTELGL